jgi:hypothetical protein
MNTQLRRIATIAATIAAAVCALSATAGSASATSTAADLPAPTNTGTVTGTATAQPWDANPPVLTGVRTGRHDAYDRAVFDFSGGTPGYRVEYGTLVGQGSGNPIPLVGAATVLIVFTGVAGTATDLSTRYNPQLPTLRQIASGGLFEGYLSMGLGVTGRVGFRVLQLTGPPRIAVDVAHSASTGSCT